MTADTIEKLFFDSDYMEGAHPAILKRLAETNLEKTPGYGSDLYTASARDKIRSACAAPEAEVFFLAGGTQTNAAVIGALLKPWQGVIAAETGHISTHEAGAIEFTGHKVMTLPPVLGKISAGQIEDALESYAGDDNHDHMVMPGMVYLSQPTEYGTLYSLAELEAVSSVCRRFDIPLYIDGARLSYALACPENDVTLADLARLCDVFYIGGTKCGALFGEAVVIPRPGLIPHFFTIIKQRGALLAKGRIAGLQFDTLFTDGLYRKIGENAIRTAGVIKKTLSDNGYPFAIDSPTNQIFIVLDPAQKKKLTDNVSLSFWENLPDGRTVMRIATSWATSEEDVKALCALLKDAAR